MLDQLVAARSAPGRPEGLRIFLELAETLDLFDQARRFRGQDRRVRAARDCQCGSGLRSPAQVVQGRRPDPGDFRTAIAAAVDPVRPIARLAFTLPAALPGSFEILVGFDGATPTFGFSIAGVTIADTIVINLEAAVLGVGASCTGELAVKLDAIHVPLAPLLRFTAAGDGPPSPFIPQRRWPTTGR